MTTQPQPEALATVIALLRRDRQALADSERSYGDEPFSAEARDWLAEYDDAIKAVEALHAECEALRADRDSWERQCSDRVDDAVEFLQQRDEARAECEALRATQSDTLLRLLCDLRFALGDNGARMQHDLVEYARGMRADAERWREFRTFVVGKSTPGFLNGKPAAYMVLPAITVPRVGMTLDESIDAARAAKEQSNG